MKTVTCDITWTNRIEVEVPDDLDKDEMYTYIMDNYQGEIDLALSGSCFDLEIYD